MAIITKQEKGSTLIELIMVIAILAMILTTTMALFFRSIRGGSNTQAGVESEQNSRLALNIFEKMIRNSVEIVDIGGTTCPGSGTTLTIKNQDGGETVFNLTGDNQIASNGATISSKDVNVESLEFECNSQGSAPSQIIVRISAKSTSTYESNQARDYELKVSLREY